MQMLLLAALLAAAPGDKAPAQKSAAADSTKAFPFPTEQHTLDNGLRVVLVPYDSPGLAAYYTLMRVGSRNEVEQGRSGFAHFFEHMMFRGTKAHPSEDYNATVTKLGLNTNAFTSSDHTVYHLYGPSKALPTIIEYEADRFQNLSYDEPAFRTEAGAIRGEYDKSHSNPEQQLYESLLDTAFSKHTYKHTTIGFEKDILDMPTGYEYSKEFFRRYYTPDNAVIVVVGDFDRAKTFDQIKSAYSTWKGKLDAVAVPKEPKQAASRRKEVAWPNPTLPRLCVSWHTPAAADIKGSAQQMVLSAYLFGPTSPLYQSMVLGKQYVDSMFPLFDTPPRDPSLFGTLMRVKDPKRLKAIESAVLHDIKNLAGGRVDAKRMDSVRSNLKYSNIMSLETPKDIAVTLAVLTSPTGDVDYFNKLYAEIDKVKPQDLAAFARANFQDKNRTTIVLQTSKAKASKATAGGAK